MCNEDGLHVNLVIKRPHAKIFEGISALETTECLSLRTILTGVIICAFVTRADSNLLCGPDGQFQHPTCFACTQNYKKRNAKFCFRSFSLPLQIIHDCVLPPCYSKCNRIIRKYDWRSVQQNSDHTFHTRLRVRTPSFVCDS